MELAEKDKKAGAMERPAWVGQVEHLRDALEAYCMELEKALAGLTELLKAYRIAVPDGQAGGRMVGFPYCGAGLGGIKLPVPVPHLQKGD